MNTMRKLLPLSVAMMLPVYDAAAAAYLEEVVVTARKREESLQETPVSVLAFSPDALESQNIGDLADLNAKLPSVSLGGAGGLGSNNASFYIRGLGTARNAVNQESAVALYIDDFYYGRSDGALLSVVDVENIEVLRGPQGTLFGRNASAGAIRYVTKKPDFEEQSVKIKGNFGTDNRANVSVSANLPLSDSAALGLLAATVNQDGFVTNALGQELGEVATDMFRAYLRAAPSESIEILTQLDYSQTDSNGGVSQAITFDPVSREITGPASGDYETSLSDLDAVLDSENLGVGFNMIWDVNEDMSLKWVSTYRTMDTEGTFDFDGNTSGALNQDYDRGTDSWSTELQLSGETNSMKWMTGLFYYVEESEDFRLQGPNVRHAVAHDLESFGVFAQATFDVTEKLSFTTGLRYTEDEKDATFREGRLIGGVQAMNVVDASGTMWTWRDFAVGTDVNNIAGTRDFTLEDSWDAISGRLSLEYQAAEDIFLFASYARGFRAGGINDRPQFNDPAINYGITSFDEEILDVYELGIRSEWMESRLRLNLTYFFQDMDDLQYTFQPAGATTAIAVAVGNAATAESKGIEGELIFAATDNLTLDATFGILDAEITDVEPTAGIPEGADMEQAPELKYNLGATYDVELSGGSLTFRVDYSYQDETQGAVKPSNVVIMDDYDLISANVRYTPSDEKWSIALYGKNMGDEEYYDFAFTQGPFAMANPRRGDEYGVKFELNL